LAQASDSNVKADGLFEIGKLYCDRGDYFLAIEKLSEASGIYLDNKNSAQYLKTINLLLRLYAETEQEEKINSIKEKLQDLVLNQELEPDSKVYYTLGLCASHKDQLETALDYLQKALSLALAKDDKADLCYAISGFSIVYFRQSRWEESLKEIQNLKVFFEVLDLPEVKISALLTQALVLSGKKEYEKALDLLWSAYEIVRSQKTMQMHIYLLYAIGRVYLQSGEKDLARMYLNLASKAVDPKNMIRLARQIETDLVEVGGDDVKNYDLVFDLENHSVIERRLGRVDFKNQFILLDLLRLFVQHQGQVYSKEYLVENVWKQSYDPSVHDNKVYVTIKRLRKLIEPDFDRPKYIFRAKNGYFMNKTARILMDQGADKNQVEGGQL
jgi:tetratricopeptide (TPR) repeat protein